MLQHSLHIVLLSPPALDCLVPPPLVVKPHRLVPCSLGSSRLWSLSQVAAEGGRPRKKLSIAKCSIRSCTLLKSLKYLSVASPALQCHFSIGSLSVGLRSHHRLRLSDELNPSLLSSLLFTLEYLFLSSLCISVHSVCAAPCRVGFKCLSHWSSGMSWSSITDSKRVKNRSGSAHLST